MKNWHFFVIPIRRLLYILEKSKAKTYTRSPWLPEKKLLKFGRIIVGSRGRKIPSGFSSSATQDECLAQEPQRRETGTGSCAFVCSLLLSQLCARSGQCLCARQNFNKAVRR
ncbi:hypothetical protein FQA47_025654 [Oryzias melastigma]|uniref:Uncharacterized protein n=1 Tax=Oryzias melastigma TaxID=30732 RepID=A0A834C0K8_ORYME|nr:hypothetical protein FQA47_025654 [Oryzias melastigma]